MPDRAALCKCFARCGTTSLPVPVLSFTALPDPSGWIGGTP